MSMRRISFVVLLVLFPSPYFQLQGSLEDRDPVIIVKNRSLVTTEGGGQNGKAGAFSKSHSQRIVSI